MTIQSSNNKIKAFLSPSALQLMEDCESCFWLDKKMKVKRPAFPFPRILSKIDLTEKSYYDNHRLAGTLPEDLSELDVRLFENQSTLDKWRKFGEGLKYEFNGNTFMGLVDDVLISNTTNKLIAFDFKSVGDAGNTTIYKNHKIQLSSYAYLLNMQGFEVESYGILCFRYPNQRVNQDLYNFSTELVVVEPLKTEVVEMAITKAIKILDSIEPPPGSPNCMYCKYRRRN